MAQMEFTLKDYGTLITSDGKISHAIIRDSLSPGQLFTASIGG